MYIAPYRRIVKHGCRACLPFIVFFAAWKNTVEEAYRRKRRRERTNKGLM